MAHHHQLARNGASPQQVWDGKVLRAEVQGLRGLIHCEPDIATLKRQGLRAKYQNQCNNILYDVRCGLSEDTYRVQSSVLGISGNTITINSDKAAGWYTSGKTKRITTADQRMVTSHVINANNTHTLTMSLPFESLSVGETIYLYAGCDHTAQTCKVKFNNLINARLFNKVQPKSDRGSQLTCRFPFLALAVSAAFTVVGQLLMPKPKGQKPASFNELEFPTATEDRSIPLVVGTVLNKAPNCVWWGDYSTKAIKQRSGLFT
jgi:hypothetical protein